MEITKISSKGQVVIPLKIRTQLGIEEGSTLAIEQVNDIVVLKKVDIDLVRQFNESLRDLKLGKIKKVA